MRMLDLLLILIVVWWGIGIMVLRRLIGRILLVGVKLLGRFRFRLVRRRLLEIGVRFFVSMLLIRLIFVLWLLIGSLLSLCSHVL